METPRGEITEAFGYAVIGYVLVVAIAIPVAFLHPDYLTLTAAIVAVSGLPVGFIWVYCIYQPLIWGKSRNHSQWIQFLDNVADKFFESIDKHSRLTRLAKENLQALRKRQEEAETQNSERPFRVLVDRLYVQLREEHPFLAFYHVRHHTLRDIAVILVAFSLFDIDIVSLSLHQTNLAWFLPLLLSFVIAGACWKAASNAYALAEVSFGLRFASEWELLRKRIISMLDTPVFLDAFG